MSVLIVVFMYSIWSSIFGIAKIALQYAPPLFLTGSRMILGGLILLVYLLLKPSLLKLKKNQWLSILFLALFSIYLTNILEFWALQYLTAGKACFMYSFSPFFAAFFSYLHFGEKLNTKKILGLILGFLGILPVLWVQTGQESLMTAFSFFSWPTLAIIGAALCSVYGWVLLRLIVKDQMISPITANSMSMLIGGAAALLHSFYIDPWNPLPLPSYQLPPFMGWALLMVCISNILCYNLYGLLLKRFTATFLSFMGLLSPIFASLYGWVFLGEPLSWVIFVSTAIVCLGLGIVYSEELRQGYILKNLKKPEAVI